MSEILPTLSVLGAPLLGALSAYIAVKVTQERHEERFGSIAGRVRKMEATIEQRRGADAELRERFARLETKIDVLIMQLKDSHGAGE